MERRRQNGFAIIEVLLMLGVLGVGMLALVGTMGYSIDLSTTNVETAKVLMAARDKLEEIQATEFTEILREYNGDPADDPLGPGSGVGPVFEVPDLQRLLGESVTGRVIFPTDTDGRLVETADLPELGCPRDLNGDGAIDPEDRGDDYLILPVLVRVRWRGAVGERSFDLHAVLRRQ